MPDTDMQQELISALTEGTGIDFVRDAWVDENNDMGRRDYGVVTISGAPLSLWGDDRIIAQSISGEVILYIMDGDDTKAKAAQDVMISLGVSFRLMRNEFDRDLMANRWTWSYTMDGYFVPEAPEEEEEIMGPPPDEIIIGDDPRDPDGHYPGETFGDPGTGG